jgi:Domain of unknown function (DUF4258)
MELIESLRDKVAAGDFEYSEHAVNQSILRRISVAELREAIANGEVIEDYPDENTDRAVWCSAFPRDPGRSTSTAVIQLEVL